jgi:aminoglycoside 6'-N-acetyltransferase I
VRSPLTIQQVEVDSFETAVRLLEQFFSEEGFDTPPQQMRVSLQTMIAGPGSTVFLARRGQEAVGVATVTTSVGLEYGRSAELEDLYVLPKERRSGVASALIEAVCAWCREKGVSVVLVTVTSEGESEHGLTDFYRRRGFSATGRVNLERNLHVPGCG